MKSTVYALNTIHGVHTFYLHAEGQDFYLFSQSYKTGVDRYFKHGVSVSDAISCPKAHGNTVVIKTMTKLPAYIRYIEKEYGIQILNKTKSKDKKKPGRRKDGFVTADLYA